MNKTILLAFIALISNGFGYFLNFNQKAELLLSGKITDTSGNVYNIRIVPGYLNAWDTGLDFWDDGVVSQSNGLRKIGTGLLKIPKSTLQLKAYFTASPYEGIADGVHQGNSIQKTIYTEYMGTELIGAWKKYFKYANRARERESFGWWLSYPWAIIKGTINSTFRITTGSIASIAVFTYSFALRPSHEILKPSVLMVFDIVAGTFKFLIGNGEIVWGFIGQQIFLGSIIPITSNTWNTVIGVPLAFLGKAPTAKSEDGWWVIMLPESPAYAEKLKRDLKDINGELNLDSLINQAKTTFILEEILNYYRIQRDSSLDTLQLQIKEVNVQFEKLRDSLYNSHGLKLRYSPNYAQKSRYFTQEEDRYLQKVVLEYLNNDSNYSSMDSLKKVEFLNFIVQNNGGAILRAPRNKLSPIDVKSTPSTVIGEEIMQIKAQ